MSKVRDTSSLAEIIRNRRSIKKYYTDQTVTEKTVLNLLHDARWAPNHGLREPWRFIFVSKERLPLFAKLIAATYPEEIQQNREDYLNEPNAILVVLMEEEKAVKRWEDNFGAVASLIQNFSLLAWEQELGVVWKTNPHIYNPEVKRIVNAKENEKIAGFLHLGYFSEIPKKKKRTPIEEKFTTF